MKTVLVVGFGYVGKAIERMLENHYCIYVYDPAHKGDRSVTSPGVPADLAVVCVPTPMASDGSCDTSIVEEVVSKIEAPLILIKSTVSPGTTNRLAKKYNKRIVFSPEYAGESSYWSPYPFDKDMKACPFVVVGGERQDTRAVLDFLVPVLGPTKTYYQVTAKEAEVIKYMENTYFAVKVTFANEMKNICDTLGVDYYAVRTGWALDPRVDPMHTMVFTGAAGYGGKCLPKDVNGIIKASEEKGYDPKFLKQMVASNKEFRNE